MAINSDDRFLRLIRFVRQTIVEDGCVKSSGEPNILAFIEKYCGDLMPPTTFRKFASRLDSRPYGDTIETLAVILSKARREQVTPTFLYNLIENPAGVDDQEFETTADIGHESAAEILAARLWDQIEQLPLNARSTICPRILQKLAQDWEYLEMAEPARLGFLIRREAERLGVGLERFHAEKFATVLPFAAIKDLVDRRLPAVRLTRPQLLAIAAVVRNYDGDPISLKSLQFLAPNLKLGV